MRIAIISDIHANLEALEKAFEIIDYKNIDRVYCLGDTIGYGANPNECLAELISRGVLSIIGNHDKAALDLRVAAQFNKYARAAVEWTAKQLTQAHIDYLSHLPYTIVGDECTFVHATPDKPDEWNYIVSDYDAQEFFEFFDTPICWVGHSHVSGVFCEDMKTMEVMKGKRFIVNVGSIGQPRNGDWRLSFGIFDLDEWKYEHVVSEYNVALARKKIVEAGLPPYLGDRLLSGM